jgi:uncharacterized protein YidB (DUF937 family)
MDVSSLLNGLTGAGADGAPADPGAAIAGVQQLVDDSGGVDGLIKKLEAGGLGEQAQSWVGTGENQPVEPQQLANALGPETVNKLSSSTGISVQSLLPLLAAFLPMLINALTPSGKAPAPGTAANQPDIGGMLGGLLGQGGLGSILGGLGGGGTQGGGTGQ